LNPVSSLTPQIHQPLRSYLLLGGLTIACLLPFINKPFHMDDPLFVWTAQHIVQHPLNPYGFDVEWYTTTRPMSMVTKNPPLACYYGALITLFGGVSEKIWHLGFMLPAVAVVLGTFRLGTRFTRQPMIAALAVLFAPGFLVSASGVMCDTLMLALWIWAVIFWVEGFDSKAWPQLLIASLLMGCCALTKYFGMSLIPLLLLYSITRRKGTSRALLFFLIPATILAAYQVWTSHLYGRGLLSDAMVYAGAAQDPTISLAGKALEGLAFAGGCFLASLSFLPLLWSRVQNLCVCAAAALICFAVGTHHVRIDESFTTNWTRISIQLAVLAIGGFSVLALLLWNLWKHRDSEALLLSIWGLGTFIFAALLNWTLNARSILPLIPAVAILLARRLDSRIKEPTHVFSSYAWVVPLILSAGIAVWLTVADARLAKISEDATSILIKANGGRTANLYFEGHWAFQYYMQLHGAKAFDVRYSRLRSQDVVAISENNTNGVPLSPEMIDSQRLLVRPMPGDISTMSLPMGSGFYTSLWGPLPFAVGPVPPERFKLVVTR
jgi:Dolichyl-phosphate-mannose-protein mannosyltransferase